MEAKQKNFAPEGNSGWARRRSTTLKTTTQTDTLWGCACRNPLRGGWRGKTARGTPTCRSR
eukprot:4446937-Lingulodinium_polyedra.AAC.1